MPADIEFDCDFEFDCDSDKDMDMDVDMESFKAKRIKGSALYGTDRPRKIPSGMSTRENHAASLCSAFSSHR